MTPTDHLSPSDVAGYIDHSMTGVARERAESHLSDCAQCREELVACGRLVHSAPTWRRRRLVAPLFAAAVAASFLAIVFAAPRVQNSSSRGVERGTGAVTRELTPVAPRSGTSVAAEGLRFTWRADTGAVGYRVVVTTSTGTPVWRGESRDTSAVPSREATFVPGEEYYWRVESTRADGGGAMSRPASFRIVER